MGKKREWRRSFTKREERKVERGKREEWSRGRTQMKREREKRGGEG